MDLYEWLLFLHVVGAFVAVGALTALWGLILGTRAAMPEIDADSAMRFGRLGGILVGAGMMVALVFGIWLAIDVDAYELWDGWILASLILWAFAGAMGARGGQAFEKDPVGGRAAGIRYQAITSLAILAILLLMIWKPGA